MANGYVVYNGPSMINGEPIKVIKTGTTRDSDNRKTGAMLQWWIMPTNSKPTDAVQNGDDRAVCGDCPARPANGGHCYLNHGWINGTYGAEYPTKPAHSDNPDRLGAWGDPAAMPYDVVIEHMGERWTGYTHQWRTCDARFKDIVMASVDTPQEYIEATQAGWRTFRARMASGASGTYNVFDNEVVCPASKEAGQRVKCATCLLCAGTSRNAKNVTIIIH